MSRALIVADPGIAIRHARDIISVERWLHVFVERDVQDAARDVPAVIPTMHVGYAVIIGGSLLRHGGRRSLHVIGIAYPLLVLLVVVATGDHFLLDAAAAPEMDIGHVWSSHLDGSRTW